MRTAFRGLPGTHRHCDSYAVVERFRWNGRRIEFVGLLARGGKNVREVESDQRTVILLSSLSEIPLSHVLQIDELGREKVSGAMGIYILEFRKRPVRDGLSHKGYREIFTLVSIDYNQDYTGLALNLSTSSRKQTRHATDRSSVDDSEVHV